MSTLTPSLAERSPQSTIDIIDAHAHLGSYSRFFIPEADAGSMVAVMDRIGVRQAVLSSHLAIQLDARRGNDETARAVDQYPGRIRGYAVFNPWQSGEGELARFESDERFVGIKLHPDLHEYPITGPRYSAVWEMAQSTGCPVLVHTWFSSPYDDPSMLAPVLEKYPGCRLIAGHSGVSQAGFDASIALAQRYAHLYLEICGSSFSGHVLEHMVATVGSQQVVFGSDFPFIDQRISLGRVAFANLGEADESAVLGGTFKSLMKWRDQGRRT